MGGTFGSFRNLATFIATSFHLVAVAGFFGFFGKLPNRAAPYFRLRLPP